MSDPTTQQTGRATPAGKRRVAFASYVDEEDLPGFLVLLAAWC